MHDFKLQWADGGQQRRGSHRIADLNLLHDAFLEQLFQTFAELLGLRSAGAVDVGEAFGGEAGDFVVDDRRVLGERVADAEAGVADKADDVAGVGFVHCFALVAEKFVRAVEADFLAALTWVTAMSRSNFPEQTRTKAMRSRWRGSMFAWILKTKPENAGSSGAIVPPPATWRGGGVE